MLLPRLTRGYWGFITMGENTRFSGELFESALQQLNVVLEELRTAYEELDQQNQVLGGGGGVEYHHQP